MFSLCSVTIEFVQVSRILIFLNSAVNAVVYSLLKKDIRAEFKRFLRCGTRQQSLVFDLAVRGRETLAANQSLDIETEAPKSGQPELGHSVN